ncbi:MAG: phosphatidate cytidylyltransferase [Candidatus Xenobia bacterium]
MNGVVLVAGILGIAGVLIRVAEALHGARLSAVRTIYRSWFVITPAFLLPLLLGHAAFAVAVMLLAALCVREFYRTIGLWEDAAFRNLTLAAIVCMNLTALAGWQLYGIFCALPVYFVAFCLLVPVWRDQVGGVLPKVALGVLSILYFGWFFAHLTMLDQMPNGFGYVLYLALLTELNDVLAFTFGKLLGRHALEPHISPNKTVEGTLGALAGVMALAFAFRFLVPAFHTWHVLASALLIHVTGTLGDLIISFFKRELHVKDLGAALAGHGGVLDRCDSLLLSGTMFFHFVNYFIR